MCPRSWICAATWCWRRARFPAEVQPVFANLERNGNPMAATKKQRAAWAKELDVPTMADIAAAGEQIDVLYFVGCMGSYDQRNKKVAAAIVKLLKAAEREVRHPGEGRGVHRRPGAAHRQRIPVPDAGRSRTSRH